MVEFQPAAAYARKAAAMARRVGTTRGEALALQVLAQSELRSKDFESARLHLAEALELARADHDNVRIAPIYDVLGLVEWYGGDEQLSVEYHQLALEASEEVGFARGSLGYRQNVAVGLRVLGRGEEAYEQMASLIDEVLRTHSIDLMLPFVEDLACILAERGMPDVAARLFGAAEAARDKSHWPIDDLQRDEIAAPMAEARSALSPENWDASFSAGREETMEAELRRVHDLQPR
jgi:hypothetical protein